jgi:hypothetical protein
MSEDLPRAKGDFPGLPARRLSALARAGYKILSQPNAETSFLVQHVASDRPGLLFDTIRRDPTEWSAKWHPQGEATSGTISNPAFSETVTASINGASLIAVTALTPTASARPSETNQVVRQDRAVRFRRASTPDPTFLYDLGYIFEALLVVRPYSRVASQADAQLLSQLIYGLAEIAGKEVQVPILALHSPAQVPNEALIIGKVGPAKWPLASSFGIRVSFALAKSGASERLRLIKLLVKLAQDYRIGLAVRDPGPGSRSGNWRCILEWPRRYRGEETVGSNRLLCLPATFVGPARVGSTHAIVDFIRRWSDVGVSGCSVVSLNDLAFIHLQLCFAHSSYEIEDHCVGKGDGEGKERDDESKAVGRSWWKSSVTNSEPLGTRIDNAMNDFSDQQPVANQDRWVALMDRAYDYHSFFGYPFRLPSDQSTDQSNFENGEGLGMWFSWLTRRSSGGLETPLRHLQDSLDIVLGRVYDSGDPTYAEDDRVGDHSRQSATHAFNIEYLLCREVDDGQLRAIGKVSIDREASRRLQAKFPDFQEPTASRAARAIEDEWRTRLDRVNLTLIELTVAWRELWLGHWAAPG